ncbi:NAD(P)/FAD-dependent oxidoreductase [Pelistega europaea]|uniref:FAD-binding oxidoreductase n=1 Tax=Pelistega europaea TaxID=106147 RepID=A0A7Y4LAE1_9BURK|nr:FAD-dependent oxidoreductase [Pelistega europaea]NOL48716.1 FAD-binding oxidoreductase [Pelistega europaea]
MNETQTFSVAVVGGGIVGLSIALTLQQAGERVVIFDKDALTSGASWGNAGHIATEQVFPIASLATLKQVPKMLMDPLSPLRLDWKYLPTIFPWLMRLVWNMRPSKAYAIHQALKVLNDRSLEAWQQFVQQWECKDYLAVKGSLLVTEKTENVQVLQSEVDKFQSIGIDARWLNKVELHDKEPNLHDNLLGGIFFPQTGHVHNIPQLMQILKNKFLQLGGTVREHTEVLDIQNRSNGLAVVVQGDSIQTKRIIIAAGAFSKKWAKLLTGIDVPLDTERGYHLMLPSAQNLLSIPVTSYERRFIMTPMDQGLRLAGTVEYAGLDAAPNMPRATQLYTLAKPLLKIPLSAENSQPWMGFRPSISDSLPVIDKKEQVIFAFGHQHLGLTQAPLTAQLVKQLYFNEPTAFDLNAYRLDRF